MSVFNHLQLSQQLNGADSFEKVKSYLFQNNELLRYVLGNLDPEENYSQQALQKYIERDQKVSTLEFDVKGFQTGLKNLKTETETKFQIMDGKIVQKVSKGEVSNQLSIEEAGITIKGARLTIEMENFNLTSAGILSCVGANFSGTVKSSEITTSKFSGGTITGAAIRAGKNWDVSNDTCYMLYATDDQLNIGNFHVIESNGRYIIESDDSWVGMSPEVTNKTGRLSLWANYHSDSGTYDFSVSQSGNTRVSVLYANKLGDTSEWRGYSLGEIVDEIWTGNDWSLDQLRSEVDDLWDVVNSL